MPCNALQGLLELMVSAEQVKGPSAEVSTLLSVCIRDSLETAFRWHIEQSSKDADNDAVRICLLAKAILNLLGIEVTTFSPVLMPYLPIAADVAAKALHELFASQLLPWLATGQLSCHCCYIAVHVLRAQPLHSKGVVKDAWESTPACPCMLALLCAFGLNLSLAPELARSCSFSFQLLPWLAAREQFYCWRITTIPVLQQH